MGVGGGELLGQRLDEFRLDSLLGTGGMAEVYRALDLRLNRLVAVKVLPRALAADPNYVARFRAEARRVAALIHPHIVPVYQYGEVMVGDQRLLYQVMPILRESLRDRLGREEGGRLPPAEAGRLAVEIASALEAAHEMGLVHRDVKPENILLDAKGKAMLTDFGIAREAMMLRRPGVVQTLSSTGLPVGTPEYMAPEQLRGGPVDQRADVYGLGAVLYEMLTGVVPHEAETPYEVAALVLTAPLVPPAARNPAIGPVLEAVVVRALARRPSERYPDARGFAEALVAAIDEPDTLSLPAVGAWPRKTRRFEALPTQVPAVRRGRAGRGAFETAPTAPPGGIGAGRQAGRLGGSRRWLLLMAAALLLLAGSFAGSAVAVRTGFEPPWLAQSQQAPLPTATSTPLPTAIPQPTATAKPTATPKPTAVPTTRPTPTATRVPVGTGLSGYYFSNLTLSGDPAMTRTDAVINLNWGSAPPIQGVPGNYSVRWTGFVVPRYSETYTFTTISDDGVQLWVNGQAVISDWTYHGATADSGTIALKAGKRYSTRLEYFQGGGDAVLQLFWQSSSEQQQIIPRSQLFPS